VHVVGENDCARDGFRVLGGRCELLVQRLASVERWDRERENDFVEVARSPLATGLQVFDSLAGCIAIEDCRKVSGFILGINMRPVKRVIDDCTVADEHNGSRY